MKISINVTCKIGCLLLLLASPWQELAYIIIWFFLVLALLLYLPFVSFLRRPFYHFHAFPSFLSSCFDFSLWSGEHIETSLILCFVYLRFPANYYRCFQDIFLKHIYSPYSSFSGCVRSLIVSNALCAQWGKTNF